MSDSLTTVYVTNIHYDVKGKEKKGNEEYFYSAFYILCISQGAQRLNVVDIRVNLWYAYIIAVISEIFTGRWRLAPHAAFSLTTHNKKVSGSQYQ